MEEYGEREEWREMDEGLHPRSILDDIFLLCKIWKQLAWNWDWPEIFA